MQVEGAGAAAADGGDGALLAGFPRVAQRAGERTGGGDAQAGRAVGRVHQRVDPVLFGEVGVGIAPGNPPGAAGRRPGSLRPGRPARRR